MIEPVTFSIEFTSERLPEDISVDLTHATSDLEIYENIDMPFLTARVAFVDEMNFYERADILGAEKVKITLESQKGKIYQSSVDTKKIFKNFYIAEVEATQKEGQTGRAQTIILHLIEDIGYHSFLQNLNKFYEGKCSDIIKKIVGTVDKEIESDGNDIQQLKVIIPNLAPLDAALWLRNRATTSDGYPYFLYSTLVDKKLMFKDLGTLLGDATLNDGSEIAPAFMYSGAAAASMDNIHAFATISNYEHNNVENMLNIIKKGLIGGSHEFINSNGTNVSINQKLKFDVKKDLLDSLNLEANQKNPLFTTHYKYKELPFNEIQSRTISRIGGSNSYRTTKSKEYDRSYSEGQDLAAYRNDTIANSMLALAQKAPLTFSVNALEFLDGNFNCTIGRKIKVKFLPTDVIAGDQETEDSKFSGDYLIFSAKHILKRERQDITFTGIRMANKNIKPAYGGSSAI